MRPQVTGLWGRFRRSAGGRTRARFVLLLAAVLGLNSADISMIGAVAGKLERGLRLSNTELGLLVALPALVLAVATIPVGVLADRMPRVRLLAWGVTAWSVVMLAGAAAPSYGLLLLSRVGLGAVTAVAGPVVASLTGDLFEERERGRIYGLILSGELIGAAIGFILSGELAAAFGWRSAFVALAVPSFVLGVIIARKLPEPKRGGSTAGGSDGAAPRIGEADRLKPGGPDLGRLGWRQATRRVLAVPTNRKLILASSLGYFYLAGIETFGLVYLRGHFHLSQSVATLLLGLLGVGALCGVLSGGRIADRLAASGHRDGRMLVGAAGPLLACVLFVPALASPALLVSLPLFVLAAAALASANPALDAARLDIIHHLLWGRAEAVRTVLRQILVGLAPLVFGLLADQIGTAGNRPSRPRGFGPAASAGGLEVAFLLLLITLLAGGLLTLRARRTYAADVAAAHAAERAAGEPRPEDRRDRDA